MLTFQNRTQSIAAWAREHGMHRETLSVRLKRMDIERALTMPVHGRSISDELVAEIRRRTRQPNGESYIALAREYGMDRDHLRRIALGLAYKKVRA